jgi:hypothetical protein
VGDLRREEPSDRNGLIRHVGEAGERGELAARLRTLSADRICEVPSEVLKELPTVPAEH